MGNLENEGESYATAKDLLLFATRKISFNKFTSPASKNVIPFPSNSNVHLITLYKLHLQLCCIIFLNFSFMYTYVMLILINRCLLNIAFSMTKERRRHAEKEEITCLLENGRDCVEVKISWDKRELKVEDNFMCFSWLPDYHQPNS